MYKLNIGKWLIHINWSLVGLWTKSNANNETSTYYFSISKIEKDGLSACDIIFFKLKVTIGKV